MRDSKSFQNRLIAFVTNHDDDIYCFRKELIESLLQEEYSILVSCPYGPKIELMKHISFNYDNPVIDRRGMNPITDFKLLYHYYKLFKSTQPTIVLTYTAKPNVYASLAAHALGIPVINNLTGFGSVLFAKGLKKNLIMSLFKLAYRNSACIMFQNSVNMQMAIDAGLVKGRYRLIPGSGVNTERYPLQPYPNGGNGISGEPVVFNYIGRILHEKGVDDFIDAAKRVKQKYPQTEFNMIGFVEPTENHYEKELKDLTDQNIVIYHGSQKDVKPFIKKAHATILPSYGEGMSNVLLESASSGRFLITTNIQGCQETVQNGMTGYIYSSGDVDDLVKSIEKFLEMPNEQRKHAGELGRKRMEEMFSRKIVIDAYKEEINRILGVGINK